VEPGSLWRLTSLLGWVRRGHPRDLVTKVSTSRMWLWLCFLRTGVARQFPCPKPITKIRDGALVIKKYDAPRQCTVRQSDKKLSVEQ
jgi:hypothetical protein